MKCTCAYTYQFDEFGADYNNYTANDELRYISAVNNNNTWEYNNYF